jgi:lysyl-tRNA synthetase class I
MQPSNLFQRLVAQSNDPIENLFKPLKRIPKFQGIEKAHMELFHKRISEYLKYVNNVKIEMGTVTSDHYRELNQEQLLKVKEAIQKYITCAELLYVLMEAMHTDMVSLETQVKELEEQESNGLS